MKLEKTNILKAKAYMYEYKAKVEIHKTHLGILGRFFEKLFGTTFYSELELEMLDEYDMTWIEAYEILLRTNNEDKIYKL